MDESPGSQHRPEERTWLFDAVQRLHQAPDQPLAAEQLANLLNAHPDLQPRFDLEQEEPEDETE